MEIRFLSLQQRWFSFLKFFQLTSSLQHIKITSSLKPPQKKIIISIWIVFIETYMMNRTILVYFHKDSKTFLWLVSKVKPCIRLKFFIKLEANTINISFFKLWQPVLQKVSDTKRKKNQTSYSVFSHGLLEKRNKDIRYLTLSQQESNQKRQLTNCLICISLAIYLCDSILRFFRVFCELMIVTRSSEFTVGSNFSNSISYPSLPNFVPICIHSISSFC